MNNSITWKDRFISLSNMASILCVLDCTILPIVSFVLPLVGLLSLSSTQLHIIHHIGHQIALYFVIPIGFVASTMNYQYKHRNRWIVTLGYMGILCIALANVGTSTCTHVHSTHAVTTSVLRHGIPSQSAISWLGPKSFFLWFEQAMEMIHHGIGHRIMNLFGCSLLLLSNSILSPKFSQRQHHHHHGPDCAHHH
jgi:MerC mercury resistance protein